MLCENFKVGTLDRLGFSYEVCRAWNPRLIYCQNSGFGPVGDWSPRPSFDSVAQAFSGSMHAMGGGPSHPPMLVEWTFSDEVGAICEFPSRGGAWFGQSPINSKKLDLLGN